MMVTLLTLVVLEPGRVDSSYTSRCSCYTCLDASLAIVDPWSKDPTSKEVLSSSTIQFYYPAAFDESERTGDILPAENSECLLQGSDLLLPSGLPLLVGHRLGDAGGLQLLEVGHGLVQLPLGHLQVICLLDLCSFLVLTLRVFLRKILCLVCLVHGTIAHKLVILLRRLGLLRGSLRLQPGKVRLDYLEEPNGAGGSTLHALVGLIVEDLRSLGLLLLEESLRLCGLSIELLQHGERVRHCLLCLLRFLDRHRVLRLLLLADPRVLRHSGIQVRHLRSDRLDLRRELRHRCLELVDLRGQKLDLLCLLLPCLRI